MRRSQVVSLITAIVIGFGSLIGVLAAGWAPVLGVQLQGGVEVLLRPTEPADDEQLDQAIEIIRSRVDALGVAEPDITRQGEQVVVQLPGVKDKQRAVELVGQTAELRFRPVLLTFSPFNIDEFRAAQDLVDALNGVSDPADEIDLADSEFDDEFEIEFDDPDDLDNLDNLDLELDLDDFTTVEPEPSDSDTGDAEAGDSGAGDSDSGTDATDEVMVEEAGDEALAEEDADEVMVEEAGDEALAEEDADEPLADDADEAAADESAADSDEAEAIAADADADAADAETADIIDLDDIADEPESVPNFTAPEDDLAHANVILPGRNQPIGYVLGPAELTGDAVSEAAATFNAEWVVNVYLTDQGSSGFDAMAARYFGEQVAIVLDGVVESAPAIRATEFDGQAVISGAFGEEEARDVAVALRFGALPIEFEQDDVRTVSATLGEGTLRAGVVAGIVGLILVALYMLAYYRLLGFVAVASLAISGSLLWALISWLGESRGLALTLAGTTGIIVSIGVQVDSNIVYYERIKEEVRRGRAVRSAADASFKAAFSTIVWADLASLIGAGVLYQLTTGTVRGFALYLGLATLIDLAVSYFFMRPLVVLIARKLVNEQPRRLGVTVAELAAASVSGASAPPSTSTGEPAGDSS